MILVKVFVCVCVRFQHQLALDHPQEETRHSRIPLIPPAPLGQLPLRLKYQLLLRIHPGKVWIQCTSVNNNSHSFYKNMQVCVCMCECKLETLAIAKARDCNLHTRNYYWDWDLYWDNQYAPFCIVEHYTTYVNDGVGLGSTSHYYTAASHNGHFLLLYLSFNPFMFLFHLSIT